MTIRIAQNLYLVRIILRNQYYAYRFLNRLGNQVVYQSEDLLITKDDPNKIQILCYSNQTRTAKNLFIGRIKGRHRQIRQLPIADQITIRHDTAFKGSYILKNALGAMPYCDLIGYWQLTDLSVSIVANFRYTAFRNQTRTAKNLFIGRIKGRHRQIRQLPIYGQ
jgi:beta-xylosidase